MSTTSTLVKDQHIVTPWKEYTEGAHKYRIRATIRYDDRCSNGHNTFSITGETQRSDGKYWKEDAGGCIHEEIAKHLPEYAHLIPWHLCSSDGPTHYVANTIYHADGHPANKGWVYFTEPITKREQCLEYCSIAEWLAKFANAGPAYRFKIDEKTEKKRNLTHARDAAIWPDATDEELCQDPATLTAQLQARLPTLLERFRAVIESIGFTF